MFDSAESSLTALVNYKSISYETINSKVAILRQLKLWLANFLIHHFQLNQYHRLFLPTAILQVQISAGADVINKY